MRDRAGKQGTGQQAEAGAGPGPAWAEGTEEEGGPWADAGFGLDWFCSFPSSISFPFLNSLKSK